MLNPQILSQIRAGTATAESLSPLLESAPFIVLYLVRKSGNATLFSEALSLAANHSLSPQILEEGDSKILCNQAFTQGLERGCQELCLDMLRSSEVVLSSSNLLAIIQSPCVAMISDVIRLGLATPGLDPVKTQPPGKTLGLTREVQVLDVEDKFSLGSAVRIALGASLSQENIAGLFDGCRGLNDPSGVDALLTAGRREEALKLIRQGYPVDDRALVWALREGDYSVAFQYLTTAGWRISDRARDSVMERLLSLLEAKPSHSMTNLFFARKLLRYITAQEALKLISIFQILWLGSEETVSLAVTACSNPIQSLVLSVELCEMVNSLYPAARIKVEETESSLVRLIRDLQGEFDRDDEMREILLSKDIEGRTTIAVIVENNMLDLLKTPCAEALANEVWRGPYDAGTLQAVVDSSYMWDQVSSGIRETEGRKYAGVFKRDIQKCATHAFEFCSWKHGAFLRALSTALEYIIMYALIFAFYYLMLKSYKDAKEKGASMKQIVAALRDCVTGIHGLQVSMIILDLTLAKPIVEFVYGLLTNRRSTLSVIPTFFYLVIVVLAQIEIFNFGWNFDFSLWNPDDPRVYPELVVYASAKYHDVSFSILILVLGLRVMYGFRTFAVVGPFIQILGAVAKSAAVFIGFFAVLLLAFAMSYYFLITQNYYENSSTWRAIVTIFQTSTTVYDINSKDYGNKGDIFYIVYVVIFNIFLLSFFIALLSDIFGKMSSRATPLYLQEIIRLRDMNRPDKRYQFAVSSFMGVDVLLSILALPVFPFVSAENRARINVVLLYIEYSFAYAFLLPVYACLLAALIPLCYAKLVLRSLVLVFSRGGNERLLWRIARVSLYLLFGLFLAIFYWGTDIVHFAWECYCHSPAKKQTRTSFDSVSRQDLKTVLRNLAECTEASPTREDLVKRMLGSISGEGGKPATALVLGRSATARVTPQPPGQDQSAGFGLYLTLMQFLKNYSHNTSQVEIMVEKQRVESALDGFCVAQKLRGKYKRSVAFFEPESISREVFNKDTIINNESEAKSFMSEKRYVPAESEQKTAKEQLNIRLLRQFSAETYRRGVRTFFSQRNSAQTQQEQSRVLSEVLGLLKTMRRSDSQPRPAEESKL